MTAAPSPVSGSRIGLLGEIGFLMVSLTAVFVILVESLSLLAITRAATDDLKREAARTTEETVAILEVPLFILDLDQCRRIGMTLLASGRISGIKIESSYSEVILDVPDTDPDASIQSTAGEIVRDGYVLGTYRLDFSDKQLRDLTAKIMNVIFWVILTVIVSIVLAIRFILIKGFNRAFSPINAALSRIERGDYAARIPRSRYGDIDRIIGNINSMANEIERHSNALNLANQNLELKVEERTKALRDSLDELEKTQNRLVHSEKMSALGGLSAGIAHELNTPLGAILSSNRQILDFFDRSLHETLNLYAELDPQGRERFIELLRLSRDTASRQDLSLSTRKQRKLVEDELRENGVSEPEELAELIVELGLREALGQFRGWLGEDGAPALLRAVGPVTQTRRMAEIIELAGNKSANVVAALRSYLAPDDSKMPDYLDVEDGIEKVLVLMQNMVKHGIALTRDYAGVEVKGSPEKLGQVWLNLIRNAVQAMDYKGSLTIATACDEAGLVSVRVTDTGPGIAPDIADRIFEPFFSTKKSGEGMGIGLDVCKRIVEGHGGTIAFESAPGRTVFTVTLPEGRKKGERP